MKKMICNFSILAIIMCIVSTLFSCSSTVTVDNTPVSSVDIERFLGKWYEIARFDHRFERNMEQCTATYTMQSNGTIKVVNQGIKHGKKKTSEGKAKLTNMPGVLRVSFWGPFYSDYRILMLSSDYSCALIGGSSDDYLWILSRTPQIDELMRNSILLEAQRRGYQTDKLIWVQQKALQ